MLAAMAAVAGATTAQQAATPSVQDGKLPENPSPQPEKERILVGPANCVSEAYTATNPEAAAEARVFAKPCRSRENPFDRFLSTGEPQPLTPRQKLILAGKDVKDPANIASIAFFAALDIATDAHGAYGPGMQGFGNEFGVSMSQDVTGEFFQTFVIPSLVHQDPHYHRMPGAPFWPRVGHMLVAIVVMQNDDGRPMPNYANLIGTPLCEGIFNLYVPGLQTNVKATAERVGFDFASDPINNVVTEFVPDVAKRINVHQVLLQRIVHAYAHGGGPNDNF
jgi:hypothetical protein